MKARWLALILVCAGCADLESLQTKPCDEAAPGVNVTCAVEGYKNRDYDLVIPKLTPPTSGYPVIIALHGGGGDRKGALRTTCPLGDIDSPECLHEMAADTGYAVVAPDGTVGGLLAGRTWNAGGGVDSWRCVSGKACEENLDDVAYFDALLDDISKRIKVDRDRVFVTGLSNGGAMAHRLACERSESIAAIAPVAGALQFAVSGTCEPTRPVGILHIHGADDPCWKYEGGEPECAIGQSGKNHVGVESSMSRWASILGCEGQPDEDRLPDTASDGTTTLRRTWSDCGTRLQLLKVEGGGHTWPNGQPYLGESVVGKVTHDFGNEVIIAFFDRFPE